MPRQYQAPNALRMDANDVIAGEMTEEQLLRNIVDAARKLGWAEYHTHDSRSSQSGFPDLVLVRKAAHNGEGRGRVIFAELKRQNGKLTDAQRWWLEALASVMAVRAGARKSVEAHVWRPRDWLEGEVEAALR